MPPSGVALPSELAGREDLPIGLAVGRLRPLPGGADGEALTRFEAYMTFELGKMRHLAGAAFAPKWVVNLVVFLVVLAIWRSYRDALAAMGQPGSEHLARILADESGLYKRVAKRTGQPLPKQRA